MSSSDVKWYDYDYPGDSLADVKERHKRLCPRLTASQLEALWQLRMTVWDGYVISKSIRDDLVRQGLVDRLNGWQFITREGMAVLDCYGLLKDDRYGTTGIAGRQLWTLKPEQFRRLREEGWIK